MSFFKELLECLKGNRPQAKETITSVDDRRPLVRARLRRPKSMTLQEVAMDLRGFSSIVVSRGPFNGRGLISRNVKFHLDLSDISLVERALTLLMDQQTIYVEARESNNQLDHVV